MDLLGSLILVELSLADLLLSDSLLLALLLDSSLDEEAEVADDEELAELVLLRLDDSLLPTSLMLEPLDPLPSLDDDCELDAPELLELTLPLVELDGEDELDPEELPDALPTDGTLAECEMLELRLESERDAELERLLLEGLLELLGEDDELELSDESLDDEEWEDEESDDEEESDEEAEDELPEDDEPSQQRQPIVR